ncbi:MAG: hypothetical protein U0V48_02175 [Anaerolineales bacterium]
MELAGFQGEFGLNLLIGLILRGAAQRLVLAAGCHENQLTKRNNVFERIKAAKRNVANCPPQTMLGGNFERRFDFAEELLES